MPETNTEKLDLSSIRARLESARGPTYWQSLEELAGTEGFLEFLHREFPRQASEWVGDEPGRRRFLTLMGASLALAGLSACTKQPLERIMPYVRQPEEIIPGQPLFFATAMPLNGVATGLLVESHMGRPTKIEGNPGHPSSLGAAGVLEQASVLGLYDPDRSQTVLRYGEISVYNTFLGEFRQALADQKAKQGAGIRILTETVTSPAVASELTEILKQLPGARWHQWDPVAPHNAWAGTQLAFGEPVNTFYKVENAQVILSLDSDFLTRGPGAVRYAREFAARRRVRGVNAAMNRLYAVESMPTNTGAKADHRWPLRASEIAGVAAAIAREMGIDPGRAFGSFTAPWIKPLAADLKKHAGASLVVPGDEQPPAVHALAHALNHVLGNAGKTVIHTEPLEARPSDQLESLRSLVADMQSGACELLLILGGNPVYNAPADIPFGEALQRVKLRVHLGFADDETSELCHWHLPETHYLESWSDARAYDGTITILQPLIAPLYHGKSVQEVLAAFTEAPERSDYDIVRSFWQARHKDNFEAWWRRSVHDGLIAGSALPPKTVAVKPGWTAAAKLPATGTGLEIIFKPDACVFDGRFANNGWLQELPKPLSKLTWDNAALLSPATAERLGLANTDVVELRYEGRKVEAPVWILPGHAPDSVTVHLGYGRTRAGRVGTGVGFSAYRLRTAARMGFGSGLEMRPAGRKHRLASTQDHWRMEGRELIRSATLEKYEKSPDFARHHEEVPPKSLSLYQEWKYEGHAWGMAIDLNACNGCGACVVACQAENNIAVVGKEQVLAGREMHWIRVDRYYEGGLDAPSTHHQPVMCMHCEQAPCESVCPVAATVHSSEGLNDMVYNRCVGTRYCSHNCPYKVRRFNFFLYSDWVNETIAMQKNPDVTVRSRGVMEKCSYCVQRINGASIAARREDRKLADGEIETACQQTCPAQAIVFGDINDPASRVAKLKQEQLSYGLLAELNTRPRTSYLASLINPNPEIGKA